jgi:hypothetical protein
MTQLIQTKGLFVLEMLGLNFKQLSLFIEKDFGFSCNPGSCREAMAATAEANASAPGQGIW